MARNKLIIYLQHLCVRDCGKLIARYAPKWSGGNIVDESQSKVTIVFMLL